MELKPLEHEFNTGTSPSAASEPLAHAATALTKGRTITLPLESPKSHLLCPDSRRKELTS